LPLIFTKGIKDILLCYIILNGIRFAPHRAINHVGECKLNLAVKELGGMKHADIKTGFSSSLEFIQMSESIVIEQNYSQNLL